MNKSDITWVVITNPHDIHITALMIDRSQPTWKFFVQLPGSGGVGRISCGLLSILCLGTRGGQDTEKPPENCDETWRCHLRKVYTSEYWEILHGKVRKKLREQFERFGGKYNTSIDFQFGNWRLSFSNFNQRSIPNDFLCITINHSPSTFGRPDCSMIFCKFNPGHPGRHNQVVLHNRFEPGGRFGEEPSTGWKACQGKTRFSLRKGSIHLVGGFNPFEKY